MFGVEDLTDELKKTNALLERIARAVETAAPPDETEPAGLIDMTDEEQTLQDRYEKWVKEFQSGRTAVPPPAGE